MGCISVTISDAFSCLTEETENYVNESSLIWKSAVLISTYVLLLSQRDACYHSLLLPASSSVYWIGTVEHAQRT